MHPKEFEYFAPQTVKEATKTLTLHPEDAKILAGGHSLVPIMKLRLAAPKYLVDITRIKGLSYVKKTNNRILIGATLRYSEAERSDLLQNLCPIIIDTIKTIGDPQVRNRGTIGGNIAHADPANDIPPTMLALDAEFLLEKPPRKRLVKARDFFLDTFTTALRNDEVLTEIRIPIPRRPGAGTFLKFERRSGDFATVSVAVHLTLDKEGTCDEAKICLGAVGATVLEAHRAEKVLRGSDLNESVIAKASELASEEADPTSDLRGSVDYKREMIKVFTRRALEATTIKARRSG